MLSHLDSIITFLLRHFTMTCSARRAPQNNLAIKLDFDKKGKVQKGQYRLKGSNKPRLLPFSIATLSPAILWPFVSLSHPVSASAWGSMSQSQSHSQARGSFPSRLSVTLISITSRRSCAGPAVCACAENELLMRFPALLRGDFTPLSLSPSHKIPVRTRGFIFHANHDVGVCATSRSSPDKRVLY